MPDERLREKEFGAFHQLTKSGIRALFPEEAKLRDHVGRHMVLRLRRRVPELPRRYVPGRLSRGRSLRM